MLWFGTGYATGDPFRWSPVTVELLLDDWFPRKVVAEPAYLAKLPDVVRGFIRYCHDRQGIRAALTAETLAAVDHYEPEYQRAIRSDRPQGPAALLARMFEAQDYEDDDLSTADILLEGLDRKVGGRMNLQNLDDAPLPDEPFEWAGIPEDVRPVVQEVLDSCDRCADELFDVEHRTAMRRFLSRAAAADPATFRRKASPVRGAAAVAWVIGRANDTVGGYSTGLTVQEAPRVVRREGQRLAARRTAPTRQRRRPTPSVRVDGARCPRPAHLEAAGRHHRDPGPLVQRVRPQVDEFP